VRAMPGTDVGNLECVGSHICEFSLVELEL